MAARRLGDRRHAQSGAPLVGLCRAQRAQLRPADERLARRRRRRRPSSFAPPATCAASSRSSPCSAASTNSSAGRPAGGCTRQCWRSCWSAAWVGLSPGGGPVRVAVTSGVLALLTLAMARDLVAHARDELGHRWPFLLGVPVLLASFGFAFRAIRALLYPDSVAAQMTRDSALNVGSAFGYIVIALAFHATLMALVVARLTAQLRHRSRHDGLTGLLDRRAIEENLQTQMQRSRRTGETFSVLMLDLDHFKSINDRFGHAVGDRVLVHVAAVLEESFREVDRLGRIGGEEFLALMPGAALDAAGPVAERVRERLSASPVILDASEVHLSVSIGMAQWHPPDEEISRLLGRADSALYLAKAQGRDRVVTANAELTPLSLPAL